MAYSNDSSGNNNRKARKEASKEERVNERMNDRSNSRGISLQSLCKRSVSSGLGIKVCLGEDVVTKSILGRGSARATSGTRRDEESNVWDTDGTNSKNSGSNQDKVH